jgi:prevent-host-death family protein
MNIKNIISISEARKNIFDFAEKVQKPGVYYTFTENGRPKAVLMGAEEFESWQETLEVMRDFPELKKEIAIVEEEYRKGDYITLDELLAKQGYVLADKSKKKYGVSGNNSKKGSKRAK